MDENTVFHNELIDKNLEKYKHEYKRWYSLLECDFSLVFHGYGSKIDLLNSFVDVMYPAAYVVTLNGFSDNFNLLDVIDLLANQVLCLNTEGTNFLKQIDTIVDKLQNWCNRLLVLVVHNFEKVQEFNSDSELVISQLACLNCVRFIASIDHIHSTINFSQTIWDKLNIIYIKSPTFMPYIREIQDIKQNQVSDDDFEKSVNQIMGIYQAINENSKIIFRLLVEEYIQNYKKYSGKGINLQDFFYSTIKNDLMITFDTFRLKVFELSEQKVIEIKNEFELSDQLIKIPFSIEVLNSFLENL